MTLSSNQKKQFEKDLNNSERYLLAVMSKDRKVSIIREERNIIGHEEILKEIRLMNTNIEATLLLHKEEIKKTKEHVWLVTWFYNHTKISYTTLGILVFTFIDKLIDVYHLFESKLTGG